jgi:hypothetical protein
MIEVVSDKAARHGNCSFWHSTFRCQNRIVIIRIQAISELSSRKRATHLEDEQDE